MEKVVKTLFVTLLALAVTGVASADFTTTVYSTAPTPPFGATYNNYGASSQISWTFDWTADLATLVAAGVPTVTSASLVVNATDIYPDSGAKHLVYLNDVFVGQLEASVGANDSEFNLLPDFLADLDGDVNMKIQLFVDSRYDDIGYRADQFNSSTLTLGYSVDEPDPPIPPTPPVVPAPAAIILSSLGAGLVGWLRKRNLV